MTKRAPLDRLRSALLSVGVLSVIGLWACDKPPVREDVPGMYIGSYLGGEEVFDIRADGRFSQTFTRQGKALYNSTGTWSFDALNRSVEFEPLMRPPGEHDDSGKPASFDGGNGGWRARDKMIIFSEDDRIWVRRK